MVFIPSHLSKFWCPTVNKAFAHHLYAIPFRIFIILFHISHISHSIFSWTSIILEHFSKYSIIPSFSHLHSDTEVYPFYEFVFQQAFYWSGDSSFRGEQIKRCLTMDQPILPILLTIAGLKCRYIPMCQLLLCYTFYICIFNWISEYE